MEQMRHPVERTVVGGSWRTARWIRPIKHRGRTGASAGPGEHCPDNPAIFRSLHKRTMEVMKSEFEQLIRYG
jgi:hypothetical protein